MAEARAEFFQHLRGERRRAGYKQTHRRADLARGPGGEIEQANIYRGHAEEQRGAEFQEGGFGLPLIEALQQAHAAAAGQPAMQPIAERVYVEERQRQQKAIGRGDLPARNQTDGVGGEIVVREDGALGSSGGPRCIDDASRCVAIERNHGPAGG